MKLCVPKPSLKGCNSPRNLKCNKENAPQQQRKAFGTKYSLSLHDNVLNDQTNIIHEKQTLHKIESHIYLFDDMDNQRPQSVHRRKIIEKLSKSQNKRITSSTLDNFISKDESSPGSFNIWNEPADQDLPFFDLYQQRHQQYDGAEKIQGSQILCNIKKLMGQNLNIKYLSRYPWFAQETTASNPSLLKSKELSHRQVIAPLQRKVFQHQRKRTNGEYNEDFQSLRYDTKARPKSRVTRKEEVMQTDLTVNLPKRESQPHNRHIASPEILLQKLQQKKKQYDL